MNEVKLVNFEIERIFAGWFDVTFYYDDKKVTICGSDAWGNDAPAHFLQIMCDCMENKVCSRYVVFDEEPGTYIILLDKKEQTKLTILYSEWDNDEWKEVELFGELNEQQIRKMVPVEESILDCYIDFPYFLKTVVRAFEEYEKKHKRDKYKGNWMEFPLEELRRLRHMVEPL